MANPSNPKVRGDSLAVSVRGDILAISVRGDILPLNYRKKSCHQLVFSAGSQKVRLTVKGSAAVDPESELEDSHHVLEERGVVWNAVLGLVDIVKGTNSYYKLQLLEGDSGRGYYVFRSWGRVGTTIGGTKLEVRA